MKKVNKLAVMTAAAVAVLAVSGCRSAEKVQSGQAEYAIRHFEAAKYRERIEGKKLSLRECIELAGQSKLKLRCGELEEKSADELRIAEVRGSLPALSATDDVPALLDFSLAAFSRRRTPDQKGAREQRVAQNLTLDVARAYFAAAAAQKGIRIVTGLLEESRIRYEQFQKQGKADPDRAFCEIRSFAELEKRLAAYVRCHEKSCAELRSLLGMTPAEKISVEDAYLDHVPAYGLPGIEAMTQIALLMRPELRGAGVRQRLSVPELRNEVDRMMPQLGVLRRLSNVSASPAWCRSWSELGLRAARELLTPAIPASGAMPKGKKTEDIGAKPGFAPAVAIMAQTHIADGRLAAARQCYEAESRISKALADKWRQAKRAIKFGGVSQLELDRIGVAAGEAEAARFEALGRYHAACYAMLNAMGIDADSGQATAIRQELRAANDRAAKELELARREYNARAAAARGKAGTSAVNQSLTNFGSVDFISIYDASPARAAQAGKGGK